MAYIYVIQNDINDKVYIGKTLNTVAKRWQEHRADYLRRRNEKRPLYSAMRKYGIEHFFISELEQCDDSVSEEREIYWIDKLEGYTKGYNATLGGDGKRKFNYDINKILELYNSGYTIQKIAEELGYCRETVSVILMNKGFDTFAINSQRMKENSGKKCACYDKKTNIKCYEFCSQGDAARFVMQEGLTAMTKIYKVSTNIGRACKGQRKTAFGYIWRYIE